ncbi:unnamed protein product, partial [Brassica napus]
MGGTGEEVWKEFGEGLGSRGNLSEARLVMMGEECLGGSIVKAGSAGLTTVVLIDPDLVSESAETTLSSMITSGTSEKEIWLAGCSLQGKVVKSVVDWGFTVAGTVTVEVELVREGERGGNSARKAGEGGSGGSGGVGGGPPGVDDDGFRMAARPDEESQGFSLEDIANTRYFSS